MSKTTKYKGKTIRPRGAGWQVDFGTRDGKRVQKSFSTKEDAKLEIDSFKEQRALADLTDKNRAVSIYHIGDKDRMDFLNALEKLNGRTTLTEAVDFYLSHTAPDGGTKTVSEVLERCLDDMTKAGRRPDTVKTMGYRIGGLAKVYGDAPIHEITTDMLIQWLDKKGYQKKTRINYRIQLVGFFNYAKKNRFVQYNPAQAIEIPSIDESVPEILNVQEVLSLLRTVESECPSMIPYFTLGLFAGLRPSETKQLDWKHINLTSKVITVRPEVAKKRRQRHVDVSDNLLTWLAPYRQQEGKIPFSREGFESCRKNAKVTWANSILRHCFGSYHMAHHESAAKAALQMGHTGTDILFNHYRELVTRDDAKSFWEIVPRKESNLIKLTA